MDPLTLTDARHAATVERWLDQWLTTSPAWVTPLAPGLHVSADGRGALSTWGPGLVRHATRASLVAYVVAWARGSK